MKPLILPLLLSLFLPLNAYGGYVEHQGYLYGGGNIPGAWEQVQ